MIKKISLILLLMAFLTMPTYALFFKKKQKPVLIFSPTDPRIEASKDERIVNHDVFRVGDRIYFLIYTPEGFKSDYIKYQVIKQDDKAHVGGYSRIRNVDCKVKDKNYYVDYIVLSEAGKYALQIFDIENIHHWIAFGHFLVVNE